MFAANQCRHGALIRQLALAAIAMLVLGAAPPPGTAPAAQRTFASPAEAVEALVAAVKAEDRKALASILGPEGRPLIWSGDRNADRQARMHFIQAYDAAHRLDTPTGTRAVLLIGPDAWPLPIPIVKDGDAWRFDSAAGKEEILTRRIGRNELSAVQVCLAYVDAQREYAQTPREADGLLKYARQFRSDPGKKNGLYWPSPAGDVQSPLGPLVAQARAEGPRRHHGSRGTPTPYHGYVYRILTAQGPDAPGGAYDYLVNGQLLGGFALVAYPARYGVSGVMTFLVNHQGVVYEKDLGPDTATIGSAMQTYNPDPTWKKAEEPSPAAVPK
jgi:hypothetical protein